MDDPFKWIMIAAHLKFFRILIIAELFMMPDCCSSIVCTPLCLTALPTPPFDFAASSHLATAGIDNISGDNRDGDNDV